MYSLSALLSENLGGLFFILTPLIQFFVDACFIFSIIFFRLEELVFRFSLLGQEVSQTLPAVDVKESCHWRCLSPCTESDRPSDFQQRL